MNSEIQARNVSSLYYQLVDRLTELKSTGDRKRIDLDLVDQLKNKMEELEPLVTQAKASIK